MPRPHTCKLRHYLAHRKCHCDNRKRDSMDILDTMFRHLCSHNIFCYNQPHKNHRLILYILKYLKKRNLIEIANKRR